MADDQLRIADSVALNAFNSVMQKVSPTTLQFQPGQFGPVVKSRHTLIGSIVRITSENEDGLQTMVLWEEIKIHKSEFGYVEELIVGVSTPKVIVLTFRGGMWTIIRVNDGYSHSQACMVTVIT